MHCVSFWDVGTSKGVAERGLGRRDVKIASPSEGSQGRAVGSGDVGTWTSALIPRLWTRPCNSTDAGVRNRTICVLALVVLALVRLAGLAAKLRGAGIAAY